MLHINIIDFISELSGANKYNTVSEIKEAMIKFDNTRKNVSVIPDVFSLKIPHNFPGKINKANMDAITEYIIAGTIPLCVKK